MDFRILSESKADLKQYMDLLSDIRRSTVILCDSIRIRDGKALGLLGVKQSCEDVSNHDNTDPVRCPVYMEGFEDPTVVLNVCGHGMHKECAKSYIKNLDDGSGSQQAFGCPICRAAFPRKDILELVGVLPSSSEASAWRAVQLTAPWKKNCAENEEREMQATSSFDSLPERLYVNLRALFQRSNDFARAMGASVALYDNATRVLNDAMERARDIDAGVALRGQDFFKRLEVRTRKVEERERRLLDNSYRNEAFIEKCVKAVRKEEELHLEMLESMVRRQNRLDRTTEEIKFRHAKVENEFRIVKESRNVMLRQPW